MPRNENLYFKEFKLPRRKNHFWHLIYESPKGKLYYIHTSGNVGVVYKNGQERLLKGYLRKNKDLVVKIGNKPVKIKNLVAKEIFENYTEGIDCIKLLDGNPRNCDCYNMKIFTKQELGMRTGSLHNKGKKIMIDGVTYPSIRKAAKANFVSYQTLLDKVSRKRKKSVLDDREIIME